MRESFFVVYHFHQFKYNFFFLEGEGEESEGKYFNNMLYMHSAAPRFGVFNRTTLIDFHFASRFSCTRRWSNTILNFGSHSHESLFNISCIFGGCLKEWNSQLIGIFLFFFFVTKRNKIIKLTEMINIIINNYFIARIFGHDKQCIIHTIAVVWSTTFFVVKSHLFPTSSLFTFSHA